MKCPKCGGLMVHDYIYENGTRIVGARCVCCGKIIDPTIAERQGYRPVLDEEGEICYE